MSRNAEQYIDWGRGIVRSFGIGCWVAWVVCGLGWAQGEPGHTVRARRFLAGRGSGAGALVSARAEHAALVATGRVRPAISNLSASWVSVGPGQVASTAYGTVSGRVSSIAVDSSDATGNTVYVGTTGGGVWKSTNAAGAAGSVVFAPLTDTLPVFSGNAGSSAGASLSIGAVSVGNGVVLAGTGDTNDATDSYYGSGVLRSADGGVTWTLIQGSKDGVAGNHSFVGLGFAGFAWSGAGTVVAAVGDAAEGDLVNAPDEVNSVKGLYYSTDAGVTWQMAVVKDGGQVVQTPRPSGGNGGGIAATAVVWNPVRQMFFAVLRNHGYYGSADGLTWTRLVTQPGAGMTAAACPALTVGSNCPVFRGVLAVQAATGDMFALTVDANNVDQGLWQDVCAESGGACGNPVSFGTRLGSSALEVGNGISVIAQGDYDLTLAAAASGADTLVYVGTEDLYRCSLAAGCALRNTTNALNGCAAPAAVSPAQHAVVTGANGLLYLGNDGGLWRSLDGVNETGAPCAASDAGHFQNLNGGLGSLAEVVSFAQDPVAAGTLIVGLGANGTAATGAAASAGAWPQVASGEGGVVAIDAANPLNWYVSTAAGMSVRECGKGAGCGASDFAGLPTIGDAQVGGDEVLIAVPWLLDPALTAEMVIGTCRVWRGAAGSGAAWSSANAISGMFGGTQGSACGATNGLVRSLGAGGAVSGAVAAQNAGSQVIYAGMAGLLDGGGSVGGHLFATAAAGTASGATVWSDLAKSLVSNDGADGGVFNPGGFDVSSVVSDGHDGTGQTVYATVMGFGVPHVYRSTNGGAVWTNISSNLPDAPANGLVVDPNDANTVYVALDTGVYVTENVSTCSGLANCWSVYGTSLPNAPVIGLAAAVGMATGDGRTGELRVGTYGRGVWEIPLLTATTAVGPVISLSSAALTFGSQAVGSASVAQTLTVTNAGAAALTVSQVVASGDFFVQGNTCTSVAVGGTCSVQVSFLPTATGTRSGVLTVYGSVAGGQATVSLTGTGAPAGAIVLNPTTVTFPATLVNATSAAVNVTVSNTGGVSAAIGAPGVTGDFQIAANTCGASLASQVGCTVALVFTPTAAGTRTGSFTVTDSSGTQTVALSGVGTAPATDGLSPLTLVFAAQQLTTASAVQQVTLTNAGDAALTLIAAQITAGDFTAVNSCGNSLGGHSSCSIGVAFAPKSLGIGTGTMVVSDEFRTQTVALSGTGVAPPGVSLAPSATVGFAATAVGGSSSAQTVTVTNNGGVALSLQGIVVSGDFAIVAGSDTCGAIVAPGGACVVQVVFAPTVGGARTGSLTVMDNAANSPQTLSLSGMGVDFSLSANGSTSVTIASGSNAVFPLLLQSAAGVTGAVTFACSGVPANATCVVTPGSGVLGSATTVSVTVDTGVAAAGILPRGRMIWMVLLVPVGLLGWRRRVGLACCVLLLAGCGAGRLIPATSSGATSPSGGTVTASGTYGIVVSGTCAGLERVVDLTLVVQ